MGYPLFAHSHTYARPTWNDLAARLVRAREEDRPLLPSEAVALVEATTELALAAD